MSKAYILGFIAGLALLIVAGVAGFQLQQRNVEEEAYRAEIVDATPAQLGALTQKQRIHSKFYTSYREIISNETISNNVAKAKGHTKIVTIMVTLGMRLAVIDPETPESYFGKLARESDAVIRGRVTKKDSYIAENEGFILTDYDVEVTEVLKNNATAPLENGATITVTRPGGKVVVDDIVVRASDAHYSPLPKTNHNIVLFLQFIPETGSYKTTRPTGGFELDGSVLRPLTKEDFPPGVLQDAHSFMQIARAVSKE